MRVQADAADDVRVPMVTVVAAGLSNMTAASQEIEPRRTR
jgi:hypothetical protein